jgi:phosphoribosylformylglycinamidine synthase
LANLGISTVADVRVGKHIQLTIEADSAEAARATAEEAARKLLANQVMEHFEVSVA